MGKDLPKDLDQDTIDWVLKQEELMREGEAITRKASDEALAYVVDAVENLNDRAWRKMAMDTQSVQMGVGMALADHLVPVIYKDMEKSLHKRLKISKETAKALRHIYIGRVIKNISKELHERDL